MITSYILTIVIGATTLVSIILVLIFLFLAFRTMEMNWSYRISKPYTWDEAVRRGDVSKDLLKIERSYRDKVRFYTIWLLVNRLKRNNVAGAFAELGVYKGETAQMIHAIDPSRKLLLFDTFEGFDQNDLAADILRKENASVQFSDTSIDLVRHQISGNENISFYKGYFPDTAKNLNDTFAFVHLDADLYLPTLAGLRFFFPRMSSGGVIMVHDYNHTWDGARKAVDEFVKENNIQLTEISDWQGSAVISKP